MHRRRMSTHRSTRGLPGGATGDCAQPRPPPPQVKKTAKGKGGAAEARKKTNNAAAKQKLAKAKLARQKAASKCAAPHAGRTQARPPRASFRSPASARLIWV